MNVSPLVLRYADAGSSYTIGLRRVQTLTTEANDPRSKRKSRLTQVIRPPFSILNSSNMPQQDVLDVARPERHVRAP